MLHCNIKSTHFGRLALSCCYRPNKEAADSFSKGEPEVNLTRSYKNWREYRTAVAELGALSNRNLADIGVNRADIRAAARKTA